MISRLGRHCMELSYETYILIVRHVATRSDLASLCRVSKPFRRAAERLLYNTLSLKGHDTSIELSRVLSTTPRLAFLVEALSIYASGNGSDSEDSPVPLPEDYWTFIASALAKLHRLRFLNVFIEGANDGSQAWVLAGCPFQLRTFHCDFEWDEHLSDFLDTQLQLSDLYIADFKPPSPESPPQSLDPRPLPRLATLECTYMEAASALVPGRPVTRLKTCFSASQVDEKRAEMRTLFSNIRRSRRHLRSLDIADASYTQDFSLELLTMAVNTFSSSNHLRYLGTLVLPVGGRERLAFYGTLMRLSRLQCVEVEVTDWDPTPTTPAALRALTFELRLYCPSVSRVVYVCDFDRVVMKVMNSRCFLDEEVNTDTLWREI